MPRPAPTSHGSRSTPWSSRTRRTPPVISRRGSTRPGNWGCSAAAKRRGTSRRPTPAKRAQRSEALLDAAAQAAQRKVQLLQVQERLQLASKLDVEQAIAAAAKAKAQAADPRAAVVQHAQTLAVLLGKSEPDPAGLAPEPLPQLAAGDVDSVPADLLRTRPEIRYAETQVLKAAGELGIAKA